MSSRVIIEVVIIFLLILANRFFAASEIAVVSVRKGRLQQQADEGNTNAQKALELATHPDRFLATVQIGITFIATFTAPVMAVLSIVARPVIAFINASVNLVLRLVGLRNSSDSAVTEEDIVQLTHEGIVSGTVEAGEGEFVQRVFRFTDLQVSAVMTPLSDFIAVEVGTGRAEVIQTFLDAGHSRLPLYEDSRERIVGVLYAKDMLQTFMEGEQVDLRQLAHEPSFVSEDYFADDLLTKFRLTGIHLAFIRDENGQVIGLVTLEDLVEELVGEIQSEYQARDEQAFAQRGDGSWLVDGMVAHDIVWERIGIPAPENEKPLNDTTLAEFIQLYLEHNPSIGDLVTIGNATLEIVDIDGKRIDKVLI